MQEKEWWNKIRIKPAHRKAVAFYLNQFYSYYPNEKYTAFHFVKYLKARLKNNKDAWFGVSGDTGVGKSLFVIMMQILFGRPFDLTKNITYIPKGNEIVDKLSALQFNTFLIDEAAKQMRRVQWQDKQQQKVNITAMTDRFKNNAVFLNLPNFDEFTKSMRIGSLIFRVIIPYRTDKFARVIIQRKSRNWRSQDPWGDKQADEIYSKLERKKKEITNDFILSIERSLPSTIMDFIVPNLELIVPDVTTEYERLKRESRLIDSQNEAQTPDTNYIYKLKYQKLMARMAKVLYNNELDLGKTRVTKIEMAKALGIGTITFNKYLSGQADHKD